MIKEKYDVVIIGGGIGGLMLAHKLISKNENLDILLIERGKGLDKRSCPIVTGKTPRCIKCDPCNIMEGMGGAGAFSDGKYNISTEYGGWLPDIMDKEEVMKYILQADEILMSFGATDETYKPDDELKKLCLQYDLHMQQAKVKHLGTDANFKTMVKLVDFLKEKIQIETLATMTDVNKDTKEVFFTQKGKEYVTTGENVVFAIGRAGASNFRKW